jgi:hypothetical protein
MRGVKKTKKASPRLLNNRLPQIGRVARTTYSTEIAPNTASNVDTKSVRINFTDRDIPTGFPSRLGPSRRIPSAIRPRLDLAALSSMDRFVKT